MRQVLEQQVRPMRCMAVVRYARALADAQTLDVDDPSLRIARDGLRAPQEPDADCVRAEPRLVHAREAALALPRDGLTVDVAPLGVPLQLAE